MSHSNQIAYPKQSKSILNLFPKFNLDRNHVGSIFEMVSDQYISLGNVYGRAGFLVHGKGMAYLFESNNPRLNGFLYITRSDNNFGLPTNETQTEVVIYTNGVLTWQDSSFKGLDQAVASISHFKFFNFKKPK